MCGIAGILGQNGSGVRSSLQAMVACQTHRGPDDEGFDFVHLAPGTNGHAAAGCHVGLGQRRLSILDLSPAGHQPMVNPQTGDILTYNGELYNFQSLRARLERDGVQFRGHSDTEVILHALHLYGPKCIEEMQGMFAFAFLDRKNSTLLLARDPMGIKPLYIAETSANSPVGRGLIFASEVRALLSGNLIPREIDRRGLAGLLAHGSVPEPLTFFKGISCFPAGCYQIFKIAADGSINPGSIQSHWKFPAVDHAYDEPSSIKELRATLDVAVRDHLISDVPVGVFLSSGLDSTIVAALAARHSPRMRCFTIGFADAPDLSESPYAARTAAQFGLEHRDIQITAPDALDSMQRWLGTLDQPSMDGFNTYVVSQAVRREGIIVALSGLGGDELLGGYPSFENVPSLNNANRRLGFLPKSARGMLFAMAGATRPRQVRDKLVDMGEIGADPLRLYVHRRRMMSNRRLAALGIDAQALGMDSVFLLPETIAQAPLDPTDLVASVSRFESMFYMRNVLLRDSDTNGMAHSLEIRVPMLDRRMLDLCYRIPGKVRLPRGVADKHLLRAAFADLLRPELLEQKKMGFTLPIRRWMAGPLRPLCEDAISTVRDSGLVENTEVDAVWNTFLAQPEMQVWSSALALVVLGSYLKRVPTLGQVAAA